jgi:hypothetical protein
MPVRARQQTSIPACSPGTERKPGMSWSPMARVGSSGPDGSMGAAVCRVWSVMGIPPSCQLIYMSPRRKCGYSMGYRGLGTAVDNVPRVEQSISRQSGI